jgi:hypothetical protein
MIWVTINKSLRNENLRGYFQVVATPPARTMMGGFPPAYWMALLPDTPIAMFYQVSP